MTPLQDARCDTENPAREAPHSTLLEIVLACPENRRTIEYLKRRCKRSRKAINLALRQLVKDDRISTELLAAFGVSPHEEGAEPEHEPDRSMPGVRPPPIRSEPANETEKAPPADRLSPAPVDPPSTQVAHAEIRSLKVEDIVIDTSLQVRHETRAELIDHYKEAMDGGANFPPIEIVDIDGRLLLADGFHRIAAAKAVGRAEILAAVRRGTQRDAYLLALERNSQHGERLTIAERRDAALRMLRDGEWHVWSNETIARKCGLSGMTIGRYRESLQPKSGADSNNVKADERKYLTSKGVTRRMKTRQIGRTPKKRNAPLAAAEPDGNVDSQFREHPLFDRWIEATTQILDEGVDRFMSLLPEKRAREFAAMSQSLYVTSNVRVGGATL